MATEAEPDLEPPECSRCEIEMEFVGEGSQKNAPLVGSEVEYQRFACPECGQGARYERSDPDEEWSRAAA